MAKKEIKLVFGVVCILLAFISIAYRYINGIKVSNILEDTNWVATDGSYAVFKDGKLTWYQSVGSKNYYEGNYDAYIGESAKKFLINNLKEYGVTEKELNDLLKRNKEYNIDNLIVVDINYKSFMYNGSMQTIARPHVPWFGFILEDGTILDVANMNTQSYYKFKKTR